MILWTAVECMALRNHARDIRDCLTTDLGRFITFYLPIHFSLLFHQMDTYITFWYSFLLTSWGAVTHFNFKYWVVNDFFIQSCKWDLNICLSTTNILPVETANVSKFMFLYMVEVTNIPTPELISASIISYVWHIFYEIKIPFVCVGLTLSLSVMRLHRRLNVLKWLSLLFSCQNSQKCITS